MAVNVRRRLVVGWQILFLLTSMTWLLAPYLNSALSYKTSLISHYEVPGQPYAWLFRLGDIVAALLVMLMAAFYIKIADKKLAGWLLLAIGFGLILDPLLPTTCQLQASSCAQHGIHFSWHATESILTAAGLFVLSVYDAWKRKKVVTFAFIAGQIIYGLSYLTQLSSQRFNTALQFGYETVILVWLAWFCRDFLAADDFQTSRLEQRLVTLVVSAWAFLNGVLAILVSLTHLHLLGRLKSLYFAGNSAWLAQHGVIVGVAMLYLSRHLYRGERRARQIFLAIVGIEALKYAVITPSPVLVALYGLTFIALFVLRDDFDRGTIILTWQMRLKDLYVMVAGLMLAAVAGLIALDRDNRVAAITSHSLDNFTDYVARRTAVPRSHISSALLAHTISVFIFAAMASILWILFRPYKLGSTRRRNVPEIKRALAAYSSSPEDYFKYWPDDKNYFWDKHGQGFISYKIAGSIAFALADPLGPRPAELLESFRAWCRARRLTACFLPVPEEGLALYETAGFESLQIGAGAMIKTKHFLSETINDKWWRWKRNRAEKAGYSYGLALPPHKADFMASLKQVSEQWLSQDGRVERCFALGYFSAAYLQACKVHYLSDAEGKVVAFTNEVPAFKASPTFTIDLLRYTPSGSDAMPYLLYKTIEQAAEANPQNEFFDLGFVPFAKAKDPFLVIAQTLSANRFSAKGLEQFKNKFDPVWRPYYLAYDGDLGDLAAISLSLEAVMKLG